MDIMNVDPGMSDEEPENDDGIQRLVQGLNLSDLARAGAEFAVHVNEDDALDVQTSYEGPNVLKHCNLGCLGPEEDGEEEGEQGFDGATPFDVLAEKMSDLIPNGKVKKRIITEGYGEVVPGNALVWFHHNSYVENLDTPFDSSYLRGPMTMLRLNDGRCILGLDIGLCSMKCGEKAEFLIHPDYAYGKLGVPPRIPESAYVLIVVEMIKFVDNALAMKMGELTEEELKTKSFEEIYKGALNLLYNGKHEFSQKRYSAAAKLYRNGIHILENCDMKSDEEDKKNEALRLKMYSNLGVCYNKMNRPKQAIVALHKALNIDRNGVKILYQLGLAHLNLSSYDEAKKYAFLARNQAPNNTDISMLLQKIEKKMEMYHSSMVTFARKAFQNVENCRGKQLMQRSHEKGNKSKEENLNRSWGVQIRELEDDSEKAESVSRENSSITPIVPEVESDDNLPEEFKVETVAYIEDFVNDPIARQIPLPLCLSYEEEIFFKRQARLYNLRWREEDRDGRVITFVFK